MEKILIGLVSGIVSGTGMGGGTVLIFLLTIINNVEQHIAQATNLIFFIPTSIMAIIVNLKKQQHKSKARNIYINFWNTRSNYRSKYSNIHKCRCIKKIFWSIFTHNSIT